MVYDIETVHLHRVKSLYMPSDTHAKQKKTPIDANHFSGTFKGNRSNWLMGKMPNVRNIFQIDVIHCRRNTSCECFFGALVGGKLNSHAYANSAEGGVFFRWLARLVFSSFIHKQRFQSESVKTWASDSNDLVMMISNCRQIVWNNDDFFYEIVDDYLYKKKFFIELTKFF